MDVVLLKDDFRGKAWGGEEGKSVRQRAKHKQRPWGGGYPKKMRHCYVVEANDRANGDLGHLFTLTEKETKLDSYFIAYPKTTSQYIIDLNVIYHLEDRENILIALR